MVTQKWEIKQMVPIKTAIYKKSTSKSIIDLILATPLFLESLIFCNIKEKFNHDLDHQLILSWQTLQIVDNSCSSRLLLSKMYVLKLKKVFVEQLVNNLPRPSQTTNNFNVNVYFVILTINSAITMSIFKARFSSKSILGFNEECKEA